MTKKKSSNAPNNAQADALVEPAKPRSAPKRTSNVIDDIFSKKKRKKPEDPVTEQAKPSPAMKGTGNEIDDIFAGKKKKIPKEQQFNGEIKKEELKPKSMRKNKKRVEDREGRFTDTPARSRKKTGDGLNIYTEDELGFNKADGGGTRLCPFDCDCCF